MEIPEVRRQLRAAIDQAKREAAARRERSDAASRAYAEFLERRAVPTFRTFAAALVAEGFKFKIFTPADSVKLASESAGEDFVESFWIRRSIRRASQGIRADRAAAARFPRSAPSKLAPIRRISRRKTSCNSWSRRSYRSWRGDPLHTSRDRGSGIRDQGSENQGIQDARFRIPGPDIRSPLPPASS